MDAVKLFADEAERFAHWAETGTDTGGASARNALLRLTTLYLRALELPLQWHGDDLCVDPLRVKDEEWMSVFKNASRLPLDFYGVVFDSTKVPPEEPVIGSLSDDIADIFRDVVLGLRLYNVGRVDAAVWVWVSSMTTHWGRHATSAVRALHNWLADNEPWAFSTQA
ncbi:MAG: DUF5063 domain-containing protein [Zavarzinella sp.]